MDTYMNLVMALEYAGVDYADIHLISGQTISISTHPPPQAVDRDA
jgi:hypothetical protein